MARLGIHLLFSVLVFCSFYILITECTKFYLLGSPDSRENNSCLQSNLADINGSFIQIQDLEHISDRDIEILLCSAVYRIKTEVVIDFTGLHSVIVTGVVGMSQIICLSNNSGLKLRNVSKIRITNVTFVRCGVQERVEHNNLTFITSVSISDSTDLIISSVKIENTPGVALSLVNNRGNIKVTNSSFCNNFAPQYHGPGGGIYLESSNSINSNIRLEHITFIQNGASLESPKPSRYRKNGAYLFSRGGGINAYFRAGTHNLTVSIVKCTFINNMAMYGGALHASYLDSAQVMLHISESSFEKNAARDTGGAVDVGYISRSDGMFRNHLKLSACNFTGNKADYGGGAYLYAAPYYNDYDETNDYNSSFAFRNCRWTGNSATYGAAVLVRPYTTKRFYKPGELPMLLFADCLFLMNHNRVVVLSEPGILSYSTIRHGRGTFYVNLFHCQFQGKVEFLQNTHSAIYLLSSILEIDTNSTVAFRDNLGSRGGAIHMDGIASIYLNDNTSVTFENNTGIERAGAIYHTAAVDLSYLTIEKCFVKYAGTYLKNITARNITVTFSNNSIRKDRGNSRGQAIYLFSGIPCTAIYRGENYTIVEALQLVGNFTFAGGINRNTIGTFPSQFIVSETLPKFLLPGKETQLKVFATDDTNLTIIKEPPYTVEVRSFGNREIQIASSYSLVAENRIKFLGRPGSRGTVKLSLLNERAAELTFNVTLQECPPGYVYNTITSSCICSANTNTIYMGIPRCNLTAYRANLVRGFWAGYNVTNGSMAEENFRTASCPFGYCAAHINTSEILLPANASSAELDELICSENRTGVICGRCKEGTSVYYHTQTTFDCYPNKLCKLGILFYVLSEIVPVTILFLVVIVLNIQLTTELNSFLFYMQILNTLQSNLSNFTLPKFTEVMHSILVFIVKMFNLKFFSQGSLSFCLFEGANSLQLLAFDYTTLVYSLLLILFTVLIMNFRCNRIIRFLQRRKRRKYLLSQSIIHGLAMFLVLCYARTTTISLQLITPAWLHGKQEKKVERVVYYYGDITFFSRYHLAFAIPALFALVLITVIPPFLLLVYPLCYRVLGWVGLAESRFAELLCKVVPLEKLKPWFDTFQSMFRDNHRYFAGLYFIYRLCVLIVCVSARNQTDLYYWEQFLLILMLVLHAWIQPYKKKWHNRMDLGIFTLLIILNGITLYNHRLSVDEIGYGYISVIGALSTVQVLLAYAPLLFLVMYLFTKLFKKCMMLVRAKLQREDEVNTEFNVSLCYKDRLEESAGQQLGASYQELEPATADIM